MTTGRFTAALSRVMERLGLEGTSKPTPLPTPGMGRDTFHQARLLSLEQSQCETASRAHLPSRDLHFPATTLQGDKKSGSSPQDPQSPETRSPQPLLLQQNTASLDLPHQSRLHKHCPQVLLFQQYSHLFQEMYLQTSNTIRHPPQRLSLESLSSFLSLNTHCENSR